MENKITGIYNNGTVKVEKYPEPIFPDGFQFEDMRHFQNKKAKWQSYESANIAEADKPYWEIKIDAQSKYKLLFHGIPNNTQVKFTIKDNKAVTL